MLSCMSSVGVYMYTSEYDLILNYLTFHDVVLYFVLRYFIPVKYTISYHVMRLITVHEITCHVKPNVTCANMSVSDFVVLLRHRLAKFSLYVRHSVLSYVCHILIKCAMFACNIVHGTILH